MLKKIISIKNVGRFRNSAATPNPQLAKHTFIIGANGYGKTTICAVLRSLHTGNPVHVVGRKTLGVTEAIAIDLLLASGTVSFDGTNWSEAHPSVAIFDGLFVADNVHSGDVVEINHRRNLYRVIIGDDGVRLAEQEAELAATSRDMTSEISAIAKTIQSHIPLGYDLQAFIGLPANTDVDDQIAAQEQVVESHRQAATIRDRASLTEINISVLPQNFSSVLAQGIDNVAAEAEVLVASHLNAHGMAQGGGNWLAEGLEHCDDSTCPLCGQHLNGIPLIAAYRSIFSERYKALAAAIAAMRAEISHLFGEASLGQLALHNEKNSASIEFWLRHCAFQQKAAVPADFPNALRDLGAAATRLLDKKSASPLDVTEIDASYQAALERYEAAKVATIKVNDDIRAVNAIIAAKKIETGSADVGVAEAELIRLKASKLRHSERVAAIITNYVRRINEKRVVDTNKEATRARLNAHTRTVVTPYERRINELLILFNAAFSIGETTHGYPGGIATTNYQLVINNTLINIGDGKTPASILSFKNTLSAGDRTTLALAFFLAHLERDPDIANKIVVFDDPFSSQDAFRRRQTVHEIVKVGQRCAQVIVLSHDATFLKQVWDKTSASDRIALTIADHRAQGSKILPIDLERACVGRTATDVDDLQTYLATGAGNVLDMIRKMRVVLETHCRTTYPSSFAANDWLGDMVRKTREGGTAHPASALYDELDQVNDYTKQYHHGEDMTDVTPDQIEPIELSGYTRRTLKIVNALQA